MPGIWRLSVIILPFFQPFVLPVFLLFTSSSRDHDYDYDYEHEHEHENDLPV
jgi:hypothetical protein